MSQRTVRNLIVALVIFTGVVGFVLFAFFKVSNSSSTLEQQISAVAAQNQQEASLLRLQRIADSSQVEREELASYFLLRESDSISFLSEIETLAPAVGMSLETQELKQITQDNRQWIEVTFSTSGNRDNTQNFIKILENIPYVSRITSVGMQEGTGGIWQTDITIQVQLLTYDK